jgi:hypothetical protein
MNGSHTRKLTRRQAITRVLASVALGTAIAAALVGLGISSSSAKVDAGPAGDAAARLGVLQRGATMANPPSAVQAGLSGASADTTAVHLLGRNVDGDGNDLYASARSNGGACNALSGVKGAVGTACVDSIPPEGITVSASDAGGWTVYGFAADDVVGVDIVVNGATQQATMLANAYTATLGDNDLGDVSALVVHHADGASTVVHPGLQAPPSA